MQRVCRLYRAIEIYTGEIDGLSAFVGKTQDIAQNQISSTWFLSRATRLKNVIRAGNVSFKLNEKNPKMMGVAHRKRA
jgi:hypothetical protein